MIEKIIRRFRIISDSLRIRTKAMSSMNQIHWGMELTEVIFAKGFNENKKRGEILYCHLPPPMAPVVIRRQFDPYNHEMSKAGLRDWLWTHVLFDDDGQIIAIHDRGEILICQDGWQCEADWFSRVKMGKGKHWKKIIGG